MPLRFGLSFVIASCALSLLLASPDVVAQDRVERAEALKQWRADCTDPDSDLRFATLEAAIATGDRAIQRICMKLALDDDDIEVQRLALALALASAERLVLEFGPSEEMQSALERATSKREDLDDVWSAYGYTATALAASEGLLVFEPADVDPQGTVSRWFVLQNDGTANENYALTLTQVGRRLDGTGRVRVGAAYDLTVRLALVEGGQLTGIVAVQGGHAFPATVYLY